MVKHWGKLPRKCSRSQACWCPRGNLTTLLDRGFNFWVALCGVRNGTLWPSWILYNSGRSESVKCLLSMCNLEHSFPPELITHYTAAATPYLRPYLFPFKEGFSASAAAGSLNNSCIVKHTSGCLHFLGQGCVCALFYYAEGAQPFVADLYLSVPLQQASEWDTEVGNQEIGCLSMGGLPE